MNRAPNFHEVLQDSKSSDTFGAHIMRYDQVAEPVVIVEVKTQRLAVQDADEEPPKHEFHLGRQGKGTEICPELTWHSPIRRRFTSIDWPTRVSTR